ncbi:MAG TPA: acyl carrier protein [Anaerolineales bacterium]|nr:acyl carrier protein [Anaerolineales bacterium]
MTDSVISTLSAYIAAKILKQPNRSIGVDEPLISSGMIDSFSLMDLALFIEDTFGVRIEDTELNASTFDTLNQLASLIESRKP